MDYKVVEIFDSIEGEGKRAGLPATFIRLAGCNLRCSYCDTPYALFDEPELCEYEKMTINDILKKLNRNYKRVTLTGGEPLISKDIDKLVSALLSEKFEINIETNGAVDISEFLEGIDMDYGEGLLFFTIDYKLVSSGSMDKMIFKNFTELKPWDVIKFVVGSSEDVNRMVDLMQTIKPLYTVMPCVFVGAVYEVYDLEKLVKAVLKTPVLCDARLQLQLHKIIWAADARGV